VGRTVTELLFKQGKAVRAMVRNEDERARALPDMGAEVVVGNLGDLDSMHRVIAGCETMYFGMSVSDAYLAAMVNAAAVAKHHGVKAFINMSRSPRTCISMQEYSKALGRTITFQDIAVAGRAARARLADSPGEPPRDHGRSAPRGTLRPGVGRRAHANRARTAEPAGGRQEECGDIHRIGKSGLSVCGCSLSTNLTSS
jgi:Trk K+ transport system NAD-binding subunit